MADFFAMGGYAFHVWASWGLSALLLGGCAVATHRRLKKTTEIARKLDTLAERERSDP